VISWGRQEEDRSGRHGDRVGRRRRETDVLYRRVCFFLEKTIEETDVPVVYVGWVIFLVGKK
jgi:hypothetical protein